MADIAVHIKTTNLFPAILIKGNIQSVTNVPLVLVLKYTGMATVREQIVKVIKDLLMDLKHVHPGTIRQELQLNAAEMFMAQTAPPPATMSYKQVIALKTKALLRTAAIITMWNLANV